MRGDAESGLSASQGSLPSTIWGTEVLSAMKVGRSAEEAIDGVVSTDAGRGHRQLAAIDPTGGVAAFTGEDSIPKAGSRGGPHVIVAGNLLKSASVIDACFDSFAAASGGLGERLMTALDAAAFAGGDSRGLMSAALLIVSRSRAPLSLRIDKSATPLADLRALHEAATSGAYADWTALVPTLDAPERATPYREKADQPV